MRDRIKEIFENSRQAGWVMEPDAKELFRDYGLPTTKFFWAKERQDLEQGAKAVGYPLVAKVVSPDIVHKSDVGGVVIGIREKKELEKAFQTMSKLKGFKGILLDEMVEGVEVIVGAKGDPQFGTIVVVGIGGTSVEIYKDVAIRMAPVSKEEALGAIESLKGGKILSGYRGREAIDKESLAALIMSFSKMAFNLSDEVDSIDLNPVLCSNERAVIADARIMLNKGM